MLLARLGMAILLTLGTVQSFRAAVPLRGVAHTQLYAKGFGPGGPSRPKPNKKAPKSAPPSPPNVEGGEIDLSAMGQSAPASVGSSAPASVGSSAPKEAEEDLSQDDIFRKFNIATPEVKRQEKKQEMAEGFEARARQIETSSQGNLITMLPAGVQLAVERVLIGGLAILGTAFILDGILITYDAFMIATKKELPAVLAPLVGPLEERFTPILLALFANSIVLGVFKLQQFDAPAATYSESNFEDSD